MVEVAVWDALATPAGDLLFNKEKVRRRGEQRRTIVVGDGQGGNWSGGGGTQQSEYLVFYLPNRAV